MLSSIPSNIHFNALIPYGFKYSKWPFSLSDQNFARACICLAFREGHMLRHLQVTLAGYPVIICRGTEN